MTDIFIYVLEDDAKLQSPFFLDLGNLLQGLPFVSVSKKDIIVNIRYRSHQYFNHFDFALNSNSKCGSALQTRPLRSCVFKTGNDIKRDIMQFLGTRKEQEHQQKQRESILVIESHGYNSYIQTGPAKAQVRLELKVLANALKRSGHKFDAVFLDACCMSSIDAIWALRDVTRYMVASQFPVPYLGMLSMDFLKIMSKSKSSLETRCVAVAKAYLARNRNSSSSGLSGKVDVCVVDIHTLDFTALISAIADARLVAVSKYRIVKYPEYRVYDLYSYFEGCSMEGRKALRDAIVYYGKTHKHAHTHGINIDLVRG